jgi:hypothetical protein
MMKNPEEKTMKEVNIDVTFKNKSNKPSNLEERLDFLRNLPIMVYIENGNKLIANFEENSVTIRPEKDVASYANFIGIKRIKGCTIDMGYKIPARVTKKNLRGGTYYFYTHSKGE